MNESIAKALTQLKEFWARQTRKRRTAYITVVLGIIAVAVALSVFMNQASYVILYTDLSNSERSEIQTQLTNIKAAYKLGNDGNLYVLKDSEASIKMQLAQLGYPKSSLNYDIFDKYSSFMSTSFQQNTAKVYQLQERLQAAIRTVDGISSDIVTLTIPDQDSFVLAEDKVDPTASVLLVLKTGVELTNKQINGIVSLVAKSVPGLSAANVTLLDETGQQLNSTDPSGISTSDRLDLEQQVNEKIKDKITTLLEPIYGKDGYRVAVNSVIDYSKMISEEVDYKPEPSSSVGVPSNVNSNGSGNGSAVPGGTVGTSTNTGGTITYPSGNGTTGTNGTYSQQIQYLVDQITKKVQDDAWALKDVSVSVMINAKTLTDTERTDRQEAVAAALGIDKTKVTVKNAEFTAAEKARLAAQNAANANRTPALSYYQKLLIQYAVPAGAALFAIILLLIALVARSGRKRKRAAAMIKQREAKAVQAGRAAAVAEMIEIPEVPQVDKPGAIKHNETREQALKKEIRDFSSANPEIIAQLIRTMVTGDEKDA